ncbi:MAG: heme NO-binding domain-containing protein [Spirosomataceae bacterium]
MKGIVFAELLEMIEAKFGYTMVDELLNETDLPSKGIYTAIGTYDHSEIVTLVTTLSEKVQISVPELVYAFGRHLFIVFTKNYPPFFAKSADAFTFLCSVDDYIHAEVKKLYPDAQLPQFEITLSDKRQLRMIYLSERKMASLAHGLIDECLAYYNERATVVITPLAEDGSRVAFEITKP